MFSRKEINVKKINEVTDLSAKVLRVLYLLLMALALYIGVMIVKETKVLSFVKTLLKVVSPLFIGILIAWLFDPFVKWLEDKKIKRIWGAIFTYLLIFLVLFLVLSSLIPLLIEQIKEFVHIAPNVFDTVKGWANDIFNYLEANEFVNVENLKLQFSSIVEKFASDVTTTMPQNFIDFLSKLFSWFGSFVLGLIIGFFLIVTFDSSSKMFNFIPRKFRQTSIDLSNEINFSLRNYVRGAILDGLLIFVLTSVGFCVAGLKAPFLFGLFCGLTNLIPYAGPYIGGAPAVIVGFTQSPAIGIVTLIIIAIIQFLEGNFLQPIIMSKTTKLHPVTIMLGLLVFGYFFGIVGMLIATPLIATVKTIFKFYDSKYHLIEDND